jgi:hypothetical protein
MMLEPDRDQIEIFVDAIFRHAGSSGFVSIRSFFEGEDKPFRISAAALSGGLRFVVDVAEDDARRAAQFPRPVVFCPPLAVFADKDRAREQDIVAGLALSVECDDHPQPARSKLESLLDQATMVVKSGGRWMNSSGEADDKLHLHWRLAKPAQGGDLAKLKQARNLAAQLVGGDPSNKPVCHPIRWPGSWHRKTEPRLCKIDTFDPDRTIDLDAALDVLTRASPASARPSNGGTTGPSDQDEWSRVVDDIVSGRSYHQPLVSISARCAGSNMHDGSTVKLLRGLMDASTGPRDLRWLARRDSIPRIVKSAREKYGTDTKPSGSGKALLWPYRPRAFSDIPRRRWLHAGHFVRGEVVMTVAPGGYGKTTLEIINCLEMATGRGLVGPSPAGPLRVAYWNAEDPDEEVERRIAGVCLHYDIDPALLHNQLFLGSRLTGRRRIASLDRGNVVFDKAMLDEIERLIRELKIDCVVFDPLVAFHRVPEGDNTVMEQIIKDGFGEIATRTDCCIELSQHTRKSPQGRQGELTADDSRGAGAIVNAARSVRVLNRMTDKEAELPKIEAEERRHYLRVSRDKTNLVPAGKATWLHLVSVQLPNGDEFHSGDNVQVLEVWDYPQPFDGVTADDMRWMREKARQGNYRHDSRSPDWIGLPLAERLGLNPEADRKKLKTILHAWIANRVLAIEVRHDEARRPRRFVVPGRWEEEEE